MQPSFVYLTHKKSNHEIEVAASMRMPKAASSEPFQARTTMTQSKPPHLNARNRNFTHSFR
jgi:hypothetical protein